jgi:hypothetical protein
LGLLRFRQRMARPVSWFLPSALAGLAIFLLGGFGAETAKGAIASELSTQVFSRGLFLGEHLRITLEEFSELLGETLILYGMARLTYQALHPQLPMPYRH